MVQYDHTPLHPITANALESIGGHDAQILGGRRISS